MDYGREDLGFAFDLLPGAAGDPPSGQLQALLPLAVAQESAVGVVESATVSLDDEPGIAPEEVRPVTPASSFKKDIHLRLWDGGSGAHLQEEPLELAPGSGGCGMNFIEQETKTSDTSPATIAAHQVSERTVIEQPQNFGLGDRPPQLPKGNDAGQVQDRFRHAGARNPDELGSVRRLKHAISVRGNAPRTPSTPICRRDVDRLSPVLPDPPELRGRTVRQARAWAAGEHSGHEPCIAEQQRMADCVDTLVHSMQRTEPHSMPNRAPAHSQSQHLLGGNQPVLPLRHLRHPRVPTSSRAPPTGRKAKSD
jgi:hypothetical protein